MMKKSITILVFFLLIPTIIGEDNIYYARDLLLDINLESQFKLVGDGTIRNVDADFYFFPIDDDNQDVMSIETYPDATYMGDYYHYEWTSPEIKTYLFGMDSKVKSYNSVATVREKIHFPATIVGMDEFLMPTEKIDINDDIIKQASLIVEGEDDMYSAVFKLASWTKENVEYDLNSVTSQASQPASWVLENRYGVCDELTNLFIAMNRALGIPARFVSGISYTDSDLFDENWGLHGWAEVYFPDYGWVSFDPTYGQYGHIDASHIKLRESTDSDKSSTKYSWQGSGVKLESGSLDIDVDVVSSGLKVPEYVDMQVKPMFKEVSFGSYNIIEAVLENNEDYYVSFDLQLVSSADVEFITSKIKPILLKPDEKKSVYWMVKIDDDLEKKYIYTIPFEIYNSFGYKSSKNITSRFDSTEYRYTQVADILNNLKEKESKTFSTELEVICGPKKVLVGVENDVRCAIKNLGTKYLSDLNVCLEKDCETVDIGINQYKELDFSYRRDEIGESVATLSAKNRDTNFVELVTLYVEDYPELEISEISFPEIIEFGPDFDISFEIHKRSKSVARNVTVLFDFNGLDSSWEFDELESNQGFRVSLDKSSILSKNNSFSIDVIYFDPEGTRYEEKYSKEIPLGDLSFIDKVEIFLNKISRWFENLIT